MVKWPFLDFVPVDYILDAYVNLNRAVAASRECSFVGNVFLGDGLAMPKMRRIRLLVIFRNWRPKPCTGRLQIIAAIQIEVCHELKKELEMCFVRLEFVLHDDTLLKEICQPSHDDRVEHVDFQEEPITDVKTIKRNTLDKSNPRHEPRIIVLLISAVAYSQRMIDGKMETIDVSTDWNKSAIHRYIDKYCSTNLHREINLLRIPRTSTGTHREYERILFGPFQLLQKHEL
jgi:hypothetical protein